MSSSTCTGNSISLLCETGENELYAVYENYFKETHVKDWKILDVLKKTFITYKPVSVDCISIFKRTFKRFASNYITNDERLKHAMTKLLDICDKVLDSNPAQLIFSQECVVQLDLVYNSSVNEEVIKDKYKALKSNAQGLMAPISVPPSSSTPSLASKRGPEESSNNNIQQSKRSKKLNAAHMKALTLDEKIECLAHAYGKNNILDLSSPGIIPIRFADSIKEIASNLKLSLPLVCSPQERKLLIQVSKSSSSLNDIEAIVKSIPLIPRTGLQSYLFISLSKLLLLYQSNQLLITTHKEGWYQGHVYADTFDAAFLFDSYYITKRTECQASTIKYLKKSKQVSKDEKDVKIDLILFNDELGDVFSCEDKPASASEVDVEADIKKAKDIGYGDDVLTCDDWESIISFNDVD